MKLAWAAIHSEKRSAKWFWSPFLSQRVPLVTISLKWGRALCGDSLLAPHSERRIDNNTLDFQVFGAKLTACHFGRVLLIQMSLLVSLCFSDWLYVYSVASRGSYYCVSVGTVPKKSNSNPQTSLIFVKNRRRILLFKCIY